MQPDHTPHEIIVGLIVVLISWFIRRAASWVNRQIDNWNDRFAVSTMNEMNKDPASYADRMVRRQRSMLGLCIYLLCIDLIISQLGWPNMTALKVSLAVAAAVFALISGAAGKVSTEAGVRHDLEQTRVHLQKRGRL